MWDVIVHILPRTFSRVFTYPEYYITDRNAAWDVWVFYMSCLSICVDVSTWPFNRDFGGVLSEHFHWNVLKKIQLFYKFLFYIMLNFKILCKVGYITYLMFIMIVNETLKTFMYKWSVTSEISKNHCLGTGILRNFLWALELRDLVLKFYL